MGESRIAVPEEQIAAFCRRNRVRSLALFGSVLREDFGPGSDVLVAFEPGARVGFLALGRMQRELSALRQVTRFLDGTGWEFEGGSSLSVLGRVVDGQSLGSGRSVEALIGREKGERCRGIALRLKKALRVQRQAASLGLQ